MFLFLFFLVNLCAIKIRLNMSDELQYGYLTPLFPIVPMLAISVQVVLAAELRHMSLIALIVAPAWILAGLFIYRFFSRSRALPAESEIRVLEEVEAPEGDEYRIMVPVANPETALSLAWNTNKIGRSRPSQMAQRFTRKKRKRNIILALEATSIVGRTVATTSTMNPVARRAN
ncbi:unnamed protein product, partial [marine sediment metagenome]